MKVDKATVEKMATLSKLEFNEKEKESILVQMNQIVAFFDKLSEINTENVLPLIHVNEEVNVLREDIAIESISQEQALKNAPQKDSDYFKMPKVLNK